MGRGTAAPVISCGRGGIGYWTGAVGEWPISLPVVGNAGDVGITPVGRYIAVVVFEIINAPAGEGRGVEHLMADLRGIPSAGFCTCTSVDTQFQAEAMDSVGDA